MVFRVLIIGGTGQVGAAVVRALAAEPSCAEVVMVNRRAIALTADPRVRQVILDTAAAQFPAEVAKLAQSMVAQGDPVHGASCVGVGKGSMKWSEEELKALEIDVVGGFARGCHAGGITQFSLLSAVGSTAKSRIRYVRVMGLKEQTVQGIGFQRLVIFRPGIIAGNAHTPRYAAWLGRLIPGRFGTIEQDDIGRAFVAEFIKSSAANGVVYLENGAMRQRSRASKLSTMCLAVTSMLALQLVIGVGIALLFPLLIYTGVAVIKAPPRPSDRTNLQAETSDEIKRANQEQITREREALQSARTGYAKLLIAKSSRRSLATASGASAFYA